MNGSSRALGSPADQAVFAAIRASADWIIVGAGTVRAERYHLPRSGPASRAIRLTTGRMAQPRLAVLSASLDLNLDLPMFSQQGLGDQKPLIMTGSDPEAGAVARLESVAEVVELPSPRPTLAEVIAELSNRGATVVLSEGGPQLNGQLADMKLIDEICLSLAPCIVGGPSPRTVQGSGEGQLSSMSLAHLLESRGMLFARYTRQDQVGPHGPHQAFTTRRRGTEPGGPTPVARGHM